MVVLTTKLLGPCRNAKYGPYLQIQKYLGLYFAVFTVKKAKYIPPNSYLVAPKFAFDVPARLYSAAWSLDHVPFTSPVPC